MENTCADMKFLNASEILFLDDTFTGVTNVLSIKKTRKVAWQDYKASLDVIYKRECFIQFQTTRSG